MKSAVQASLLVLAISTLGACRAVKEGESDLQDAPVVTEPAFPTIASLVAGNFTSVDDLMAALPDEMRRQFVLVTDSQSVQEGTPEAPRLILYHGKADGRFLSLGVSTSPSDENFDTVEMMEFDVGKAAFNFRSIEFHGGVATASEENPSVCKSCHTPHLRPNWNPAPSWPMALATGPVVEEADRGFFQSEYLPRVQDQNAPRWSKLSLASALNAESLGPSPASDLNFMLRVPTRLYLAKRIKTSAPFASDKWLVYGALAGCLAWTKARHLAASPANAQVWTDAEARVKLELQKLPAVTRDEFQAAKTGRDSAIAMTAIFGGVLGSSWIGQNFPQGHLSDKDGPLDDLAPGLDPEFQTHHGLHKGDCTKLPGS